MKKKKLKAKIKRLETQLADRNQDIDLLLFGDDVDRAIIKAQYELGYYLNEAIWTGK
jgi:hypothetical protein